MQRRLQSNIPVGVNVPVVPGGIDASVDAGSGIGQKLGSTKGVAWRTQWFRRFCIQVLEEIPRVSWRSQ